MSRQKDSLFFRLIARRYEKASLVLTSNTSVIDWGELFGDQVLATHSRPGCCITPLRIKGESYRLREKRKAGLLGQTSKPKEEEVAKHAARSVSERMRAIDRSSRS